MRYIELNRTNEKIEISICDNKIFSDENLENLSEYFGVMGDEDDLVFLGSKEKVKNAISMYGYVHRRKACADIYNKKIIIINKDSNGYYSLVDDQIKYFKNIYRKYPRIEDMPRKGGNFISN